MANHHDWANDGAALLALLYLCDKLFPIGGFGYSDGLEAATAAGLVETPGDWQAWLDVCVDEVVGGWTAQPRYMHGPCGTDKTGRRSVRSTKR